MMCVWGSDVCVCSGERKKKLCDGSSSVFKRPTHLQTPPSGKGLGRVSTSVFEEVDAKYGAEDFGKSEQVKSAAIRSQTRGSANAPMTDLEKGIEILPLLQKFKLVRMAARCFEHIVRTSPKWGDKSELYRRSLLVSQLTETQKLEFRECFDIIDSFDSGDDTISLLDLKRTMESIGAEKSEVEVR